MFYFLDSSAIVKRYISEMGSRWIHNLINHPANHFVIAQITPAEVMSSVARRVREHSISAQTGQAIRQVLDAHVHSDYEVIELTHRIVQIAEDLLQEYPLRAYDSIQLASALEANDLIRKAGLSELTFISADIRLLEIATLAGLRPDNPSRHP